MLLRTLILFLCVSSGLCATLGLLQMQKEEGMLAEDAAAVLDNTVEVSDGNVQDTEATKDDISNDPSPQVEGLLENVTDNDVKQEADEDVNEEVVVDGTPAEKVVPDSDNKTEDVPIEEANETEAPVNDQASQDQPSQDAPEVEAKEAQDPAQDQASQDIPEVEAEVTENPVQDQASKQDVPVVEMKAAETLNQEHLSQEENNEIRPIQTQEVPKKQEESHSGWGFNSIRNSFQNMHGYFDSLVELVGGRNGVCEYRCRYGELPAPRPGYQLPEPNGCSSSLVGFQVNAALDLGIPAMTQCCNQLDSCYDTCGTSKYDCDSSFRSCLHGICSDLKKSLGLGTQVQTCESVADGLFNTVWTLGCRPYMNSQRAACICHEEEKDEL